MSSLLKVVDQRRFQQARHGALISRLPARKHQLHNNDTEHTSKPSRWWLDSARLGSRPWPDWPPALEFSRPADRLLLLRACQTKVCPFSNCAPPGEPCNAQQVARPVCLANRLPHTACLSVDGQTDSPSIELVFRFCSREPAPLGHLNRPGLKTALCELISGPRLGERSRFAKLARGASPSGVCVCVQARTSEPFFEPRSLVFAPCRLDLDIQSAITRNLATKIRDTK